MKILYTMFMVVVACALLFSAGCDLADKATGTDVKAGTAAPDGGPLGEGVKALDGILPAPFNLATKLLLAGVALYQQIRLKNKDGIIDAAEAATAATLAGVRSFVKDNPLHTKALEDKIWAAHMDAGISEAHTVEHVETVNPTT